MVKLATSVPTCIPNPNPLQPDTKTYSLASLDTVPMFTRASWKARGWGQAPPNNPNKPIKDWIDTSPERGGTYTCVSNGAPGVEPVFSTFTLTPEEAATPNLPGPYTYQAYFNAPTSPARDTSSGGSVPINALSICDYQCALYLAQSINGTKTPPLPVDAGEESTIQWNGETRRYWVITVMVSGLQFLAAPLIAQWWAHGIGFPGEWNKDPNVPKFVYSMQPQSTEIVPTPCIPELRSNEVFSEGPLGMGWEVERTDL